MKRRDMLVFTAAAVCGLSALPWGRVAAVETPRPATYYVDPAAGDDANDGLTPARPLRTYAAREFRPGDTVLFKRGSVIRAALGARSGAERAPITYGAYGEGRRPAFLGSVAAGDTDRWVEERPSVWRYAGTFSSEVCNLIYGGGQSCGILRWRIDDLREPGDWHYTGIGANSSADARPGLRDGVLYLCSPTNPGRAYAGIECALWGERRLVDGQHDVVLENLSFRNSGVHGYQQSHARNVVIRNCEFRHIGGAVWNLKHRIRFGNAVELWDGASDVVVEGCVFDNIYDVAVTHQGGETRNIPERIQFRDNLFVGCGLAAYECREPSREVYFEHNTCVDGGGGFSMQGEAPPRRTDPYPQPVGYHVFIWLIDAGTQPGRVYIRHNIFCASHGAAISAVLAPADERQFVIDHNAYWQTRERPLIQFSRLAEGKTWAEAMASLVATGELPIHQAVQSYLPGEFGRYQADRGQDQHSVISRPSFVDEAAGDYRQRDDSPCLPMGMRINVQRDSGGK
ncbi:MAG: right-handed parallel beta-helix repeat-containing protein [Planctomycetia bacterium]|nr:right-handed parallel beta-helix repeat-containing protein [Planctomycetia bacterium]